MSRTKLLFLVVFLSLWLIGIIIYGYPVAMQWFKNQSLTKTIPPISAHWAVDQTSDEEWHPSVAFKYKVGDQEYEIKEVFQGEKYRNPFAAQEDLNHLIAKYPVVWYSPAHPANGTMEKYFPQKRAVYAGILTALFIYFTWGGMYIIERWLQDK